MVRKLAFAVVLGASVSAPALAQPFGPGPPPGPPPPGPPPYAVGNPDPTFLNRNHVRGFVRYFNRFDMTLGVHHAGVPVQLHQGTIIDPLGLTIRPGMFVRVDGYFNGNQFFADRIVLLN